MLPSNGMRKVVRSTLPFRVARSSISESSLAFSAAILSGVVPVFTRARSAARLVTSSASTSYSRRAASYSSNEIARSL